jgi:hypothetical protein
VYARGRGDAARAICARTQARRQCLCSFLRATNAKIRDIAKIKMAYGFWRAARMRAMRMNGDFSRASAAFFGSVRAPAALITAWEEFSTARTTQRRAGADLVKTARIGGD